MRVLVACEESQAVCIAFRERGHEAYSCDILPCSGGHPEWHYQEDVKFILHHLIWDLMIAFPPCTDLAVSGARWFEEKRKTGEQLESIAFFMALAYVDIPRVAIENPIGIMSTLYRKPDENLPRHCKQKVWRMPPSADRAKLRSSLPETILSGHSFGRFLSHRHVDFASPCPNCQGCMI